VGEGEEEVLEGELVGVEKHPPRKEIKRVKNAKKVKSLFKFSPFELSFFNYT
jgi:hypothetical protein